MKFSQYHIHPILKRNIESLGFKKPTDIQYKAIPSILKGEDVLAIAQTGTGKTAAFAIPIVHHLLQKKHTAQSNHIRTLIMVPTRELAIQIAKVFSMLVIETDLIVLTNYGGISDVEQKEELSYGVDILITTPGRMFDLQHQGFINLSQVEILVLDEADKMLAKGFYQDIQDVVKKLPYRHQTLFFSATIDKALKDLAYSFVHNPIRIQLSPKDPVSKNITHAVAFIEMDDKRFFLERFINENEHKKILIFVRTKVRAERVHKAMLRVGIETITLHGNKEQAEREWAIEAFRQGEKKIMIATDISARGIDIEGIEVVINYDLPDDAENYVHRIGRTGRGMQKGIAISFCATEEKTMLHTIEKYIHNPIETITIDKNEKNLVKLLSEEKKEDWQKLIQEAELQEQEFKKKKKKAK
ncbi:MAG: DEAD/DEAH box helicase [Chitinophagaceae bacterium]